MALRYALSLSAALLLAPLAPAQAHVHGVGTLNIAVDGPVLTLNLSVPAEALVGFERVPRNAREQAALDAARKTLEAGASQFVPSAAAQCALVEAEVVSTLFETPPRTVGRHADVDARYVFRCAQPAQLRELRVELFGAFPRLLRLSTEIAAASGQKAQRLTPRQRVARW